MLRPLLRARKGVRSLFCAAAIVLAAGTLSHAQNSKAFTEQVEGPELDGLILPFERRKDAEAQAEKEPEDDPGADLAYGAFQRGYFLTALSLALPRAESGDPVAQTLIGEIYRDGLGVARNMKKAAQWYGFAAEAGNREAQFAYANLLLQGSGVDENKEAGEIFMRRAAEAGHGRASFNLAQIITAKRPTWAGFKEALPFYAKAAETGVADAHYALFNIYSEARGVTVNDEEKALVHLRAAAERGLDTAQVELGSWLANRTGEDADARQAFSWFARAASQGNVLAQNRLARMYAAGYGVQQSDVMAGAWHVLARRAGLADSAMDARFAALSDIDRKRALEAAKRLGGG
jgi:TPR repeat protein